MRRGSRASPSSVITGPSANALPSPTGAIYRLRMASGAPSLADLLVAHPFSDDEPLLHTSDRSLTAGDARRAAVATAERLRAEGIREGHAVALQFPNGIDLVTTIFGVWLAGAVFVPVNWRAPDTEVDRALRNVGAAALVRPDGVRRLDDGPGYDADAAFVQWTSGTTGDPKAILHTHSAYVELLDRVLEPLRAQRRDAARTPTPTPNLMTVLPPTAITMLSDDPSIDDLRPLRYVRSITAPLSPVAARRFANRFGVTVLNGYGQAEIGEVIGWTAADAREHPDKVGAAGRPHPGVAIKLIGDDEVGELAVRPPRMAAGYLGGGGLEDRLDADGFLRTGDLARVDDDGFVWIEGRVGEVVNRGGNKVFPAQVEEVLLLSPAVEEAAVVGVPDDRLGEVPVAFVVGDAEPDALAALCREHLLPYKVPVAFHRVDALPRSEVGKVLRRRLVATLEDHGRLPIDRETPADAAVAAVRAWVEEHVPRAWRDAALRGGRAAIREVRARSDYEGGCPVFGRSGLVAPTWPAEYGGLDLDPAVARLVEQELAPFNLGRLNPLGLNLACLLYTSDAADDLLCVDLGGR